MLTSGWNMSSSCAKADLDLYNCTKCLSISPVTWQGLEWLPEQNCSVCVPLRSFPGVHYMLAIVSWKVRRLLFIQSLGERRENKNCVKKEWNSTRRNKTGYRSDPEERKIKGAHLPFYLCKDKAEREIDSVDSTFVTRWRPPEHQPALVKYKE